MNALTFMVFFYQTDEELDIVLPEGKVGAKKMRKLEEKAERKRQREVDKIDLFTFPHFNVSLVYKIFGVLPKVKGGVRKPGKGGKGRAYTYKYEM